MKKPCLFLYIICVLFFQCEKQKKYFPISSQLSPFEKIKLDEQTEKEWYYKDIIEDSIPGISLEKAYSTILKNKKGQEVIVAVIDTEIDINHEDLKANIWKNVKEIDGNNIDDDTNGYIDDIHGWNFSGNEKGDNNKFVNFEYTRIIKKYSDLFSKEDFQKKDSTLYKVYQRAKAKHSSQMVLAKEDTAYINMVYQSKKKAKLALSQYLKNDKYLIKNLDSLKLLHPKDSILQDYILIMSNFIKYGFTDDYVNDYKLNANEKLNKLLNLAYNDRSITGDNPDDLSDTNYGNNKVNSNLDFLYHGTLVSGIVAGVRSNDIGIRDAFDNIRIMPLCISVYGDEHDKDIALAIRYAVDNGANIINMSFGKEFSLYKNWVFDALKYAETKNVLIVSSSGNSGYNLNEFNNYYPNDNENNNEEVSDNFLLVGSSTYNVNLISKSSNYGNIDVDIFAPGNNIYTTSTKDIKYEYRSGTSYAAPMVSGVAALIYSYYPNLTVSQVKHIIMDSGVEYTFPVKTPTKENKEKTTPFNELSKSGKIVNAYNALIMADSISKLN